MKRTPLKKKSKVPVARIKQKIQDTLRIGVVLRDGGCILRNIRHCNATAIIQDGSIQSDAVIQADHLITRANSATYANIDLVVCLCQGCHGWKHWNEKEYDALVRSILPKERVELWDFMEQKRRRHETIKIDWNLQLAGLQFKVKDLENKIKEL